MTSAEYFECSCLVISQTPSQWWRALHYIPTNTTATNAYLVMFFNHLSHLKIIVEVSDNGSHIAVLIEKKTSIICHFMYIFIISFQVLDKFINEAINRLLCLKELAKTFAI